MPPSRPPVNEKADAPVEMAHYGITKTAQIALALGLAETTAVPQ
jgi:hypothetical protein